MSKRKVKASSRTLDKWSLKQLYNILFPDNLQIGNMQAGTPIGETIGADPDMLAGRVMEVPLSDLNGSYTSSHIKVKFAITEVVGTNAKTRFKGHTMNMDYIKSIVKRRKTRIDAIEKLITSDRYPVRVTATVVTTHRCTASQKHAIRDELATHLHENAKTKTLNEFATYLLSSEISQILYQKCSKIFPLANVEIQKSLVLSPEPLPASEVKETAAAAS